MDIHLFQDMAPLGERGPNHPHRHSLINRMSLWLGGPHEEYPRTEFGSYLQIRGWDRMRLQAGDWAGAHPANLNKTDEECAWSCAAVIQSWLTLGFLESVYQERIPVSQYTRGEVMPVEQFAQVFGPDLGLCVQRRFQGRPIRWFHTKDLVSNLVALVLRLNMSPNKSGHLLQIQSALLEMEIALDATDKDFYSPPVQINVDHWWGGLLPMILVFPVLLAEVVCSKFPCDLSAGPGQGFSPPRSILKIQTRQLMERNWCPFTINKLECTASYPVFYWLWARGFDGLSTKSHAKCDKHNCRAYHVEDESTYRAKHADGCAGDCGFFQPTLKKVYAILDSGKLPIIVAKTDGQNPTGFTLNVVEYNTAAQIPKFVAFSHVWADGRGSNTEKGLPLCQMNFLCETCKALPQQTSIAFWIDSLCVPAKKDLRKKAIRQMARVYQHARSVVVLEDGLQQCSIHASPEELLMRITTSPWMDRVWTFQEAVLASMLYFKLRDDFCLLEFSNRDLNVTGPLQINPIIEPMHVIYRQLRSHVQNLNFALREINIADIGTELRWRSTSKQSDELLAVCILLKFDVEELLRAENDKIRMAKFLLMSKRIPRNIIFSDAPRLTLPAFQWAPSTFLTSDERRLVDSSAIATRNGLIGNYLVFRPLPSQSIMFMPSARLTLSQGGESGIWYDMMDAAKETFLFSHVILFPKQPPKSVHRTIFIAAAVVESELPLTERPSIEVTQERIDLICTFEKVVYLGVCRQFSQAPNPVHCDPPIMVPGRFDNLKILLR
jgi:hypothetical protein